MTGTSCDLFTHNQSRSYLNHLVFGIWYFLVKLVNIGSLEFLLSLKPVERSAEYIERVHLCFYINVLLLWINIAVNYNLHTTYEWRSYRNCLTTFDGSLSFGISMTSAERVAEFADCMKLDIVLD